MPSDQPASTHEPRGYITIVEASTAIRGLQDGEASDACDACLAAPAGPDACDKAPFSVASYGPIDRVTLDNTWPCAFSRGTFWGGRRRGITEVVRALAPDLVVLSECRTSHFERLAGELRHAGFEWVIGTKQEDYYALLIASKTLMQLGPTSSKVLPANWCHVWLPSSGLSVVGIYGPLRGTSANPVPAFWAELVQTAKQLANEIAIVVGDLNTALAPGDTTSGLPLPASKELKRLVADGWRDVYREVHGDRQEFSYWDSRGAYRIDHAMLSPAAPRARNADYLRETAGYNLGRWSRNPQALMASDHAALIFEI